MTASQASWKDKTRLLGRVARVGVGMLADRIAPRKVSGIADVPASVAQITPQWLTAVLCKDTPGARVLDFSVISGSSGTSTRAGLALIINAQAEQAGVPTRLFTKSSPTFAQRMFLGFSGALIGEPGFYNDIRPQLDIEAPLGYHACMDAASWRSMVMMEDIVATRGAKFISTETYIDRATIEDLLANMAKWHGHFWNSPQFTTKLKWMRTPVLFLAELNKFVDLKARAVVAIEQYPQLVPQDIRLLSDELWAATARSFEINAQLPPTVLHGDCHIGQTYFTREGRIGYADWQVPMRGGWAYDVNYALVSALTVEDRRNWERDLLRHYLDRLHAAGGAKLGFDEAWLRYRQHALYPYFAWAYTRAGAGSLQPDFQPDYVCNDIMTRTAHAVSDLETLRAVNQS